MLSKLLPQRYGDRLTGEIAGDAERLIVTRMELVPVDPIPRLQELPARDGEVTVTPLRGLPSR